MAKVNDADRKLADDILNGARSPYDDKSLAPDLIAEFRERMVREHAQELNAVSIELCVIGQALESTNALRGKQLMTLSRKLHDRALGGRDDE